MHDIFKDRGTFRYIGAICRENLTRRLLRRRIGASNFIGGVDGVVLRRSFKEGENWFLAMHNDGLCFWFTGFSFPIYYVELSRSLRGKAVDILPPIYLGCLLFFYFEFLTYLLFWNLSQNLLKFCTIYRQSSFFFFLGLKIETISLIKM